MGSGLWVPQFHWEQRRRAGAGPCFQKLLEAPGPNAGEWAAGVMSAGRTVGTRGLQTCTWGEQTPGPPQAFPEIPVEACDLRGPGEQGSTGLAAT